MNLDAYFARLGIATPLAPTIETLRALHVAHLGAFPFHNIAIQQRGSVELDLDAIAARFFDGVGGGYCFEQNTLLAAALRGLGFDVALLLARVGPPATSALNHLLLRVDVDGRPWIADVGFGGQGPLEPVPLEEGIRVAQDGIDYSLRRDAHHWTLVMHRGGEDEDLYEFSGAPHTPGDVEVAHHYTSTHPSSSFRRTLTIQRIRPSDRVILRTRAITRYRNGERSDVVIDPTDIRRHARELFAINLGDEALLFEDLAR